MLLTFYFQQMVSADFIIILIKLQNVLLSGNTFQFDTILVT